MSHSSITLDEWLNNFLNYRFKSFYNNKLRRLFAGVFFYILEAANPVKIPDDTHV